MRLIHSAAVALCILTAGGCATTMTANSFVEPGVDFNRYRTYDWARPDALPAGDPRLVKNPFFVDHVQGEVEREFAMRGLKGPTSRKPDLLIHYHAAVNQRLNVNGVESGYGECQGDCRAQITEYEVGTLILDVVDARTKKVVWRGWARDGVDDMFDNQDQMRRKVHEAVTRMMATFPRMA